MAECMEELGNIRSEQEDEILALSSIFGDDFRQSEYPGCRTIYQIKVKVSLVGKKLEINAWMPSEEDDTLGNEEQNDEMAQPISRVKKITFQRSESKRHTCLTLSVSHLTPLTLEFSCPPNYPTESKPTFTLSCMWLDTYQLTRLCKKLDELWETNFQGEPVIFPWVYWLQNSCLEFLEADNVLTVKLLCDVDLGLARDPRGLPEFLDPKTCALKILEFDFKMVQEEFRKENHICEICFEEREGILFHFLEDCGHKFCVECLLDYCKMHVNEGTVKRLKCPESKCPATLSPIILRELLSDEDFERWERLLFQQTLDGMADVLYCPRCNTIVLQDEDETSRLAQCGGCYFAFCTDCLMSWHSTQNCGGYEGDSETVKRKKLKPRKAKRNEKEQHVHQSKKDSASRQSFEFVMLQKRLGRYQRCPKCRIMVERTSGCDMMRCSRCSQAFCFGCGQKIGGYEHFQKCGSAPENIAHRGREMLENRPVPEGALRINEIMQEAAHGTQIKLRACPRCRQRNLKEQRNNHIKCWSCKADFCYMCVKLIGNPVSAHFKTSGACQQHSDD